ncbi:protein tyrosine phosphatase family protein [Alteromonas sp. ASW11-130]|uniref:protein tyrosine phosphatase family protein n=1 Tax=Alteromonas sp. ASW11-130 TaxID=3015775 RepID=UPI00224200C0|nr:protein tyrosine phosphatase family protein [Alteromonas sp. ASW11-130]MCW8092533.1 protein tyrosine phosphatase family protein [Alteromonas sp. ASW11-130]
MLKAFHKILLIALLQLSFIVSTHATDTNKNAILASDISNITNPVPQVYSSGQPNKEQLKLMKELGVKHIINLRPTAEQHWDEQAFVESMGMSYYNIPVEGAEDINLDNAGKLEMLLAKHSGESILVHCASGNRVGALVALNEGDEHKDIEAAIATGKQWGLTRLEPVVREKLETSKD